LGYKLYLISSAVIADFPRLNVYDNQIYPAIISSLPQLEVLYTAADSGYMMTISCII
jgi:hypothetical protein